MAVAASGGRDSTALLHCVVRSAAALGIEVVALHVHHGLMPAADDWLRQVRAQSRRWGAAFVSRRLDGRPPRGASVEAWARAERYTALASMAHDAGCSLVLLAHHRRDQAETWLLQALRGAGPAGLAAMPRQAPRQGLVWARPWLDQSRQAIDAYVQRHRLGFVDDASNADSRFARNRLRAVVWPTLLGAFPDAETTLADAAARAQEAAALASEVAELDLPSLQQDAGLRVDLWLALPPARRRNALRAWLARALTAPVGESLVRRLCHEVPRVRSGRWPALGAELRLHRQVLAVARPALPRQHHEPVTIDLHRPGIWALPGWPGHFVVHETTAGGVLPATLGEVTARERTGGERFRLAPRGAARSLKKQFQARGLAAWEREGPLLYTAAGDLLFVPGLGIEASQLAAAGQAQLTLSWERDGAPATGCRQRGG